MTPLALLVVLALPPPGPFADNASWSTVGLPVQPIAYYPGETAMRGVPRAIARAAAMTSALDTETCDVEFELITDCRGTCPVPPVSMLFDADWESVYRINIGLHVEGMTKWQWQGSWPTEALLHLKATFQTIAATLLRDAGVDLRIQHVHFEPEFYATLAWINDHEYVSQQWDGLRPQLAGPVHGIMRLVPYPGGGAGGSTCHASPGVGIAGYWFDIDPLQAGPMRTRNNELRAVPHELAHQLLYLEHPTCYEPRIEFCSGGSPPSCYSGDLDCPTFEDVSHVGYCRSCYRPPSSPYPNLRLGPLLGPLARVARNNVLALAEDCLGPPVGTVDLLATVDADADEYPDNVDNCRDVANNEQTDVDLDGRGDACDSCAVVQPSRSRPAWWLLASALGLIARRRSSCQVLRAGARTHLAAHLPQRGS